MILHDANSPIVERGLYVIGYSEMVDGYHQDAKRGARPRRALPEGLHGFHRMETR